IEEISSRDLATQEAIDLLDRELDALNHTMEEVTGTVEKLTGLRTNLAEKYDHRLAQRDRLVAERNLLNERRAALAAEREFLDRLISSFEGLGEGVRNAVKAPCLAGRVNGVLADLVSADPEYLPALEAALEGSLGYIVVDSPEAARAGASHLAENQIGRAVLICADGADTPEPAPMPGPDDGILGPVVGFAQVEEKYQPL
ncbi:unnamed protein product, partial [marine sediment metagenome]